MSDATATFRLYLITAFVLLWLHVTFSFIVLNARTRRWAVYLLLLLRGRYRAWLGLCPACRSETPKLYYCKVCHGVSYPLGGGKRPTKGDMRAWTQRYRQALQKAA